MDTRMQVAERSSERCAAAGIARQGLTRKLTRVPAPPLKTLTDDRGKEMAETERLAHRLAI